MKEWTEKKPCGCKWAYKEGEKVRFDARIEICAIHEEEENNKRIEAEKREEERIEGSEELLCDKCGASMGFVDSFDLNGSRFYCPSCKKA